MISREVRRKELTLFFRYFDKLREKFTNMADAGRYLSKETGIGSREASNALALWMQTFDSSKTPELRASEATQLERRVPKQ